MIMRASGGLVLAGGLSSRMGKDKASLLLGGQTLLAICATTLRAVCAEVAASVAPGGAAEALAASLGLPVLTDHPDHGRGPLAGVASGLAWAGRRGWDILFTLPCDTPLVRPDHLIALGEAALAGRAAAFAVVRDAPQPLCAAWPVSLGGALEAALADGRHPSVRGLLAQIAAIGVAFPDQAAFSNLNSPEDLEALRRGQSGVAA